jgi:hypothetical protein
MKILSAALCLAAVIATNAFAAEKGGKTCCEKAKAEGTTCTHKCCVSAHKANKSCEKCNPNKEDLKLESKAHAKTAKKAE